MLDLLRVNLVRLRRFRLAQTERQDADSPYRLTSTRFIATNEYMHELAYKTMTEDEKKNLSATKTLGLNLGSGIVAGFAAAILSHPADTLLSQINKGHGPKGSMVTRLVILGKEAGFRGLFAGLGPRMIMSASNEPSLIFLFTRLTISLTPFPAAGLVSSQFLMYGYIKEALHASPGIEVRPADCSFASKASSTDSLSPVYRFTTTRAVAPLPFPARYDRQMRMKCIQDPLDPSGSMTRSREASRSCKSRHHRPSTFCTSTYFFRLPFPPQPGFFYFCAHPA